MVPRRRVAMEPAAPEGQCRCAAAAPTFDRHAQPRYLPQNGRKEVRYSPVGLVVIAAASLFGCQMGTGILRAGPDTYTLTEHAAPILGGSTTAQQTALTKANAYCAQQGRQFLVSDMLAP